MFSNELYVLLPGYVVLITVMHDEAVVQYAASEWHFGSELVSVTSNVILLALPGTTNQPLSSW